MMKGERNSDRKKGDIKSEEKRGYKSDMMKGERTSDRDKNRERQRKSDRKKKR